MHLMHALNIVSMPGPQLWTSCRFPTPCKAPMARVSATRLVVWRCAPNACSPGPSACQFLNCGSFAVLARHAKLWLHETLPRG